MPDIGISNNLNAQAPTTPLLLFEIDEGFPGSPLRPMADNPTHVTGLLRNVSSSLAELTPRYPVAVLIYPTHLVRPADASGSPRGLDAAEPALVKILDYFETSPAKLRVYLELYSSGIATNQNGELARAPLPRLHRANAQDAGRPGLSMDMETLAALKQRFPQALEGVRFHEVYGSDIVQQVAPPRGFRMDPEVIRTVIETCRQTGLKLIWSDSNWLSKSPPNAKEPNYICSGSQRPHIFAEPFATLQKEARKALGKNVCFNWANNNYHPTINFDMLGSKLAPSGRQVVYPLADWFRFDLPVTEYPMKSWTDARWGMSIQSWFWHELTYDVNGQYYMLGENACPVELIGTWCLKGLKEGASVLQFEPPWYFFNMEFHTDSKYPGVYEERPDFSERLALKRLKKILLNPEAADNPPADLGAWFDRDQVKFIENDIAAPPRTYAQTTVAVLDTAGAVPSVFDRYRYAPKWIRQDQDRFVDSIFARPFRSTQRIELNGDGVDEFMVLRESATSRTLEFYNQNSGRLVVEASAVVLQPPQEVLAIGTANLLPRVIKNADPDELVVVTRIPGGAASVALYGVDWIADNHLSCRLARLTEAESRAVMQQSGPAVPRDALIKGVYGVRPEAVMHKNLTRSLDRLAVRYGVEGGGDRLALRRGAETRTLTMDRAWELCAADYDLNRQDEVVGIRKDASKLEWMSLDTNALTTSVLNLEPAAGFSDHARQQLLGLRRTVLLNAP